MIILSIKDMKKTILSIIAGVACALSAYAVPACPEAT